MCWSEDISDELGACCIHGTLASLYTCVFTLEIISSSLAPWCWIVLHFRLPRTDCSLGFMTGSLWTATASFGGVFSPCSRLWTWQCGVIFHCTRQRESRYRELTVKWWCWEVRSDLQKIGKYLCLQSVGLMVQPSAFCSHGYSKCERAPGVETRNF